MSTQPAQPAQRAAEALSENYEEFQDDPGAAIIDLLTDLQHLCVYHKLDFDWCRRISEIHFQDESDFGPKTRYHPLSA